METAEEPALLEQEEELDYDNSPGKRGESRADGNSIDSEDGELPEEHTAKDLTDSEEEGEISDGEIVEEKKRGSDVEEGEITDDDEEEVVQPRRRDAHSPLPRVLAPSTGVRRVRREEEKTDVCKHYLKGICTWGEQCNFAHPPEDQLHLYRSRGGSSASTSATSLVSTVGGTSPRRAAKGGEESSWERALKEAKERSVKASLRKEDPDFERKRLEMAPSDELDRRATTTVTSDDSEVDEGRRRLASPRRDSRTPPEMRGAVRERYGDRQRTRPPAIPSLLDLRPPSPRSMLRGIGRNGKQRGVNFEINQELGPQCIYPNGRPKDQPLPRLPLVQQRDGGRSRERERGTERGGGGRIEERRPVDKRQSLDRRGGGERDGHRESRPARDSHRAPAPQRGRSTMSSDEGTPPSRGAVMSDRPRDPWERKQRVPAVRETTSGGERRREGERHHRLSSSSTRSSERGGRDRRDTPTKASDRSLQPLSSRRSHDSGSSDYHRVREKERGREDGGRKRRAEEERRRDSGGKRERKTRSPSSSSGSSGSSSEDEEDENGRRRDGSSSGSESSSEEEEEKGAKGGRSPSPALPARYRIPSSPIPPPPPGTPPPTDSKKSSENGSGGRKRRLEGSTSPPPPPPPPEDGSPRKMGGADRGRERERRDDKEGKRRQSDGLTPSPLRRATAAAVAAAAASLPVAVVEPLPKGASTRRGKPHTPSASPPSDDSPPPPPPPTDAAAAAGQTTPPQREKDKEREESGKKRRHEEEKKGERKDGGEKGEKGPEKKKKRKDDDPDKIARRRELKRQLAEIEEKLKRKREAEAGSSLISSST